MELQCKPEAQAVYEITRKSTEPRLIELPEDPRGGAKGVQILLKPNGHGGMDAESIAKFLDEYREAPKRRKGTARVLDLTSFIDHVNRFKDEDSVIFANPDPRHPALTAVLDYHRQTASGSPRFGTHRTVYPFPLSDEWKAWMEVNNKPLSQDAFAVFLEDRIGDIAAPEDASKAVVDITEILGDIPIATAARMLDLAKGLNIRVDSKVANQKEMSTGETQLIFTEEHKDSTGAPLKVPRAFMLGIPVFKFGDPYPIPVRLRYRVRDGVVTWFFSLYGVNEVFDHAFKEAADEAKEETNLPLLIGEPES